MERNRKPMLSALRRPLWAVALALLPLAGCASNGDPSTFEELGEAGNTRGFGRRFDSSPDRDFTFGPGDALAISVTSNGLPVPEYSGAAQVRSDGRISMATIPELVAAGLTTQQLSDKVASLLALYVNEPRVIVTVTQVQSKNYFVVSQEVSGRTLIRKIPYQGDVVLLDVIADAGVSVDLLTDFEAVKVIRGDPRSPVVHTINSKEIYYLGRTGGNLQIYPDDIVFFPPSFLGQLNQIMTGITQPFQGLFRLTNAVVTVDDSVRVLQGQGGFRRGGAGNFNNGFTTGTGF